MSKINPQILKALIYQNFGLPIITEYRFSKRLYRFDAAILEHKIAIEFEGGVWTQGRHTRGKGYLGDLEKYNLATVMGWRVLRYAHVQFEYNQIIEDIRMIIESDKNKQQPIGI